VNGLVADDFYNWIGSDPNNASVLYANINFVPKTPVKENQDTNQIHEANDFAPNIMIFQVHRQRA